MLEPPWGRARMFLLPVTFKSFDLVQSCLQYGPMTEFLVHRYQTELGSACPLCSKANLLTPGCGKGKYIVYCKVRSKENGHLVLKRPEELPNGFQGTIFKGNI